MKIVQPVSLHIPFLHQVTDKFYADGILTNYKKSQLINAFDMIDINRVQRPINGPVLSEYPILMYSCIKTNLNPYNSRDNEYPMDFHETIANMDEYTNQINEVPLKKQIEDVYITAENSMCATYTSANATGINVMLRKEFARAQDLYNLWETNSIFVDFIWANSLAAKKTYTQNRIRRLYFCLGIRNGKPLYL